MIELRPFEKLGKSDHGWLKANFHFSFADYRNNDRVHWGALRVWNNDRIAPQSGFPPHPHRDMEIVTYVIKGAITHQDHLGNQGRTEAGQIQVMSAGKGIQHAEYNKENDETELFQIWIIPNKEGVPARWETVQFPANARDGKLVPLASGRGHDGAIPLYADGALFAGKLKAGETIRAEARRQARLSRAGQGQDRGDRQRRQAGHRQRPRRRRRGRPGRDRDQGGRGLPRSCWSKPTS